MIDQNLLNCELVPNKPLPNCSLWILFHAVSLPCFISADWFLTPVASKNYGLIILPLIIGIGQMLLLWDQLRWPLLWPFLTILGMPLSFLGIWWFMLCIGGGFGLFQAIHLWFSGYRRNYLWWLASFIGWICGALIWSTLSNSIELKVNELYEMIGLYIMIGLAYGSSIYFALRLMKS